MVKYFNDKFSMKYVIQKNSVTVQRIDIIRLIIGLVFPFRRTISCFSKARYAKIAKLARASLRQTRFSGCASPRKTTKFFKVTPKQDQLSR